MLDLSVRVEELADACQSVCVVTSSPTSVGGCLRAVVVRKGLGSPCAWQLVHLSLCWVLQGIRWSVTQKAWSWARQWSAFCSCSRNSRCSAPQISAQHPACCRLFRPLKLSCGTPWLSFWCTFPCEGVSATLLFPSCSPFLFFSSFPFPVFPKFAKMPQCHTPKSVS